MEPTEVTEVKSDGQKSPRDGTSGNMNENGNEQPDDMHREAAVMTDHSNDNYSVSMSSEEPAREARTRRPRRRGQYTRRRTNLPRVSKNRAKQRIKSLMKKRVPKELRRNTLRMRRDSAQSIVSVQRVTSLSSNSFTFKQACHRCGHLSCRRFS